MKILAMAFLVVLAGFCGASVKHHKPKHSVKNKSRAAVFFTDAAVCTWNTGDLKCDDISTPDRAAVTKGK